MTCSECFRTVFNQTICGDHEDLEDESAWDLIGFYPNEDPIAERRYCLEEHGIISIVVEADDGTIELYVPETEKENAFETLVADGESCLSCTACQVEFAKEMELCPLCGGK
jgi:hypothetical protein